MQDRPRGTSAGANMFKSGYRFQGKKLHVHEDGGWEEGDSGEKKVSNIKREGLALDDKIVLVWF